MNTSQWFEEFSKSYRGIIDASYGDRRNFFPYYELVDVKVYLVEDPRKIIPEVVVFFEKGTDVTAVSGLILEDNQKIEWSEDFSELSPYEQDMQKSIVFYESFQENGYAGFFLQETFSKKIFDSQPKDQAEIMVQKHLVDGLKREGFKDFLKITEIRKKN